MKNKKGGILLIGIGVLLIAAAIGLCGYNMIEEKSAEESSKIAVSAVEQQIVPKEPSEIYEDAGEAEIPDYILNPEMEMPKISVGGMDYIGILEIPAIGLELPVMSEWSYPNLKIAPCRYFGSAYLDNMVIAGHDYKAHFRNLEELSVGNTVIFRDADGNEFIYSVAAKEVLPPTAVEEMTSGEWDFTLFTCTAAGTYRVAIRCDRTE